MEKLTPQIAALYLGQKAQSEVLGEQIVFTIEVVTNYGRVTDGDRYSFWVSDVKPILRPLSSLTESEAWELFKMKYGVEYNGGSCLDGYWHDLDSGYDTMLQYAVGNPIIWLKLLSWGFDLFGLIESGLAIDATKIEIEETA